MGKRKQVTLTKGEFAKYMQTLFQDMLNDLEIEVEATLMGGKSEYIELIRDYSN